MSRAEKFPVALHVMLHLADQRGKPMATERLTACVSTTPAAVRKAVSDLRKAGLVRPVTGADGGWLLAEKAEDITLHDVYAAAGGGLVFDATHTVVTTTCATEDAASDTLREFFRDAEDLLAKRFSRITLGALAGQMRMLRTHLYENNAGNGAKNKGKAK